MLMRGSLFLILLFILPSLYAVETIRIRGPQSAFDASHDYFKGLIVLAFEKHNLTVKIEYSPYMVQGRALSELKQGRLFDVYWAGSDASREGELGVIDIPLVKGLLGYRVFLTHKDNEEKLANVQQLDDLKKLVLCQGSHWPDTDIMLSAGLLVLSNPVYESMFRQTYIKRCDAFPRGINEALAELTARQNEMPDLRLFQKTILYYPFPMYFFASPKNQRLTNLIKSGLERAIDDGSFDEYIQNHPSTKHLFPLEHWKNVNYIILNNPFLSKKTNTHDSRYWISPPQQ